MGRQIIFARRTGGSRCCRFGGKSNNTTIKSHATKPRENTRSIREQHESPAIDEIRNPNIPTNAQIEKNKPRMDNLTKKLSGVKVKAKNISFNL